MILPKKIKIMVNDYQIKPMDDQEERESHFLGVTYNNEAKICIDIRHNSQMQASTLLHEVLHAVVYQMGKLGLDKDQEEKVVECMTTGICVVMRDNPKLFPLIQKALK